MGVGVPSSSNS